MSLFRRNICKAVVAVTLAGLPIATRAQEAVNTTAENVAISGYDAVADHTEARAVPGNPAFTGEWHDAIWQFASTINRDRFAADPARYAPLYGGFCAGGMALGIRAPIDPQHWKIVDGQLFLGGSGNAIDFVMEAPKARLSAADEHWKTPGKSD